MSQRSPEAHPGRGEIASVPPSSSVQTQLPRLFKSKASDSASWAVYVAATPEGTSEGRYATPSTDETHLPLTPSPDGAGRSTSVAGPSETSRMDEQPENM